MERVIFSTNMLFFWIKGEVEVDSRFIKTRLPNVIFGFLPAGKDSQNIPLKNVSGSMLSSKFEVKPLLIGLFLMFVSLGMLSESLFATLFLMAIGIGIAGNGIQTTLHIEKAGRPYIIQVPFYEKAKLQELDRQIHDALSHDTDKTDLHLFMDRQTPSKPV